MTGVTFNPCYCRNEREVESKFIAQYLLPNLGYPADSWYQEVSFGKIRLDFLVSAHKPSPQTKLSPHHCLNHRGQTSPRELKKSHPPS
jgi:hypothetical protein